MLLLTLLLLLLTTAALTGRVEPLVGALIAGAMGEDLEGLLDKNTSRALWMVLSTPAPFVPAPTPRVTKRERINAVHCMQSHVSMEPWGGAADESRC